MTLRVVPEGLVATSAAVEALTARLASAHAAAPLVACNDLFVGQHIRCIANLSERRRPSLRVRTKRARRG